MDIYGECRKQKHEIKIKGINKLINQERGSTGTYDVPWKEECDLIQSSVCEREEGICEPHTLTLVVLYIAYFSCAALPAILKIVRKVFSHQGTM